MCHVTWISLPTPINDEHGNGPDVEAGRYSRVNDQRGLKMGATFTMMMGATFTIGWVPR